MSSGHPNGHLNGHRKDISRRRALTGLAAGVVAVGASGALPTTNATAATGRRAPWRQYPKGVRPSEIHVVNEADLGPLERVLAATLQGQLARSADDTGPAIYLRVPGAGYEIWLDELAKRYGIPVREASGVWELVDRFDIKDYVVYSHEDGSVNAATSAAALGGAVALDASLEATAREHGMILHMDVRGSDDQWAWEYVWPELQHRLVVEQKPDFDNQLRDYATMAGAFTFFDGNSEFRRQVVQGLRPDATVLGWGDASEGEDAFVSMSSRAGAKTIPADHARNLACLSGIRHRRLTQRADATIPDPEPDTHHVAFLLTDGDNIQWLLGDFAGDERWYGSPQRGAFDMGWGMAPALIDLAPSVLRWYYANQSTGGHRDRFVVGPSGGGYLYPSRYPRDELDRHTERLAVLMERTDLNTVQILDFEALDDTELWSSYLRHPVIEGLIYLEYSRYDGGNGKVVWANDKPVVSPRGMLWEGLPDADEASVTAVLNDAARDPASPDGYSIVMVHAWSKDLSHVRTVVDNLAPHVKVVPPDTLVRMVGRHAR